MGRVIILLKGLTPIPYKLVTITSGFAGYNIWLFILCSIIARGGRFFIVAIVLNRYGDVIRAESKSGWACGWRFVIAFCSLGFRRRLSNDLKSVRSALPARRLRATLASCFDRSGHLLALLAKDARRVRRRGDAGADDRRPAGWPQTAPPPSAPVPRQQPAAGASRPHRAGRAAQPAPPRRARKIRACSTKWASCSEIPVDPADAEKPGRDHRRSERPRQGCGQGCGRHAVAPGQAILHGDRAA